METYIPLKDLLRHNHNERVNNYLKTLNEEEEQMLKIAKLNKPVIIEPMHKCYLP